MYSDAKKIQLIEEVLRNDDRDILRKVESILKKSKTRNSAKQVTAKDLAGTWSKKDADLIEKAIEEGCEKIYPDEWR